MKTNRICRNIVSIGGVMTALLFTPAAHADASKKDMKIIGKALSFIEGGPVGNVFMDIIYDPSSAASVADAGTVVDLLSGGLKSGKITLNGTKTEASSGASIAYIALGAESKAADLVEKGVITVSANPECSMSGSCVLSVATKPKVAIHVNSAASESTGASFGSAFRMMITEH